MVAAIEILPIAETHLTGYREAVDRVARERLYLSFFQGFGEKDTAKFVRSNIAEGNPHFVVVADGRVAGWCDITPSDRASSAHVGTLGIGLLPEFRGQGIGQRLMQTAIDAAWADGRFSRIELTVNSSNTNAIALYYKLGFELEGRKRRHVLIDGEYCDLFVMGLLKAD